MWTSAQGIFYKRGAWKVSLIDKIVGQQYSDASNSNFYKLGAYSNMDFKGSYSWDALEFSLGVSNVLNSRSIGAVSPVDKTPIGGSRVDDIFNRGGSLDTYSFQPSRGYQFTIKTRF
jgi:outer membrane receptor protein involved in Fe transport